MVDDKWFTGRVCKPSQHHLQYEVVWFLILIYKIFACSCTFNFFLFIVRIEIFGYKFPVIFAKYRWHTEVKSESLFQFLNESSGTRVPPEQGRDRHFRHTVRSIHRIGTQIKQPDLLVHTMPTTQPPVPSEPRFAAGPPLMLHRRPLVGPQLASGPGKETHGTCTGSTRRHAGPKSRGMEGSEATGYSRWRRLGVRSSGCRRWQRAQHQTPRACVVKHRVFFK